MDQDQPAARLLTERPARFLQISHAEDNVSPRPLGGGMRLGIFCDYLEEGWPSMDLCGEMLARELSASFRRPLRECLVAGLTDIRSHSRFRHRLSSNMLAASYYIITI